MPTEWDADVELSAAEASAIIGESYSEFRDSRVVAYAEGWDNAAFLVDDAVLFRFPRRTIAVDLLEREIALLPKIAHQLPLKISAPQYDGSWRGDLRWPFAGYRLLRGEPASVRELDDDQRAQLAEPLARFLRVLHAVEVAPLIEAGLPPDRFGRFDAAKFGPKALRRAASAMQHGFIISPVLLAWFEENPPMVGENRTLVHGDLYARHVLLGESDEPSGIIDWGDMHFGTPAIDLAIAHTMLPPQAHDTFREHYGSIETAVWTSARWRGIYSALLCLDYGIEAGASDMLRCGTAALALIARGI